MLAYDPATNPLNTNEWAFPLTECVHIASMALSVGTIVAVDLKLLGQGIPGRSAGQLARETDLWTLVGFVLVILTGLIIFTTDPVMYLNNDSFQLKMGLLLAGLVFHYTFHRKAALAGRAPVTAVVSLLLWTSVVFSAIFIAFV
jgi:hypothetical protein